jgi:hypothetical protein
MKTIYVRTRVLIPVSLLIVLLLTTFAARANGPGYTLDWWTVDGGGAMSLAGGGGYSLDGTIGQPDAQVWGDGNYILTGGFWGVLMEKGCHIYLPIVWRD